MDKNGYDRLGYDRQGFNIEGFNKNNYHKTYLHKTYFDYIEANHKYRLKPPFISIHNGDVRTFISNGLPYEIGRRQLTLLVDLHGHSKHGAEEIVTVIISNLHPKVNRIEIIHGYNHGTAIKEVIQNKFVHKDIIRKTYIEKNLGRTYLYIKQKKLES